MWLFLAANFGESPECELRQNGVRSSRKFAVGVSDEVEVSAGEVVLAKYSGGTEVKIEGKNT
jgi:hypothetical protein